MKYPFFPLPPSVYSRRQAMASIKQASIVPTKWLASRSIKPLSMRHHRRPSHKPPCPDVMTTLVAINHVALLVQLLSSSFHLPGIPMKRTRRGCDEDRIEFYMEMVSSSFYLSFAQCSIVRSMVEPSRAEMKSYCMRQPLLVHLARLAQVLCVCQVHIGIQLNLNLEQLREFIYTLNWKQFTIKRFVIR